MNPFYVVHYEWNHFNNKTHIYLPHSGNLAFFLFFGNVQVRSGISLSRVRYRSVADKKMNGTNNIVAEWHRMYPANCNFFVTKSLYTRQWHTYHTCNVFEKLKNKLIFVVLLFGNGHHFVVFLLYGIFSSIIFGLLTHTRKQSSIVYKCELFFFRWY